MLRILHPQKLTVSATDVGLQTTLLMHPLALLQRRNVTHVEKWDISQKSAALLRKRYMRL